MDAATQSLQGRLIEAYIKGLRVRVIVDGEFNHIHKTDISELVLFFRDSKSATLQLKGISQDGREIFGHAPQREQCHICDEYYASSGGMATGQLLDDMSRYLHICICKGYK